MPPLKTKAGRLTHYALACGYVEAHEAHGIQTMLWLEHSVYHVRRHDFNEHRRICWESFGSLTAARKYFDEVKNVRPATAYDTARQSSGESHEGGGR